MPEGRRDFEKIQEWTLAELSIIATEPIDKWKGELANAEIARRIAQAQIDSANWMKWSVIALAISSALLVVAGFGAWLYPHIPH